MGEVFKIEKSDIDVFHFDGKETFNEQAFVQRDKNGNFVGMYIRHNNEWLNVPFSEEEITELELNARRNNANI
jgi:hypothetical protein